MINNDAGVDGSVLAEPDVTRLVELFGRAGDQSNRQAQIGILIKLSNMPMRLLRRYKNRILPEMRTSIVSIILQKDGLNSDFIPADLAEFQAEGSNSLSMRAFGKKFEPERKQGSIPDGFDDTEIPDLLNMGLQPNYISKSTKLDFLDRK